MVKVFKHEYMQIMNVYAFPKNYFNTFLCLSASFGKNEVMWFSGVPDFYKVESKWFTVIYAKDTQLNLWDTESASVVSVHKFFF